MNRSVFDAFNQESLQPAGQPKVEPINTKEGEDLKFTVIFEIYPEVNLPDFSQIQVEQPVAEITKDDLSSMIETLREQRKTWEDAERSAQDKDLVNIDYVGKKEGEEFEGGAAKGSNLVLGSEQMIPGFESGIIGKKVGDQFTIALRFPKEYHNAELADAEVEFDVNLNAVKRQILPEVDEEFFKSFGVEEGGETFFPFLSRAAGFSFPFFPHLKSFILRFFIILQPLNYLVCFQKNQLHFVQFELPYFQYILL